MIINAAYNSFYKTLLRNSSESRTKESKKLLKKNKTHPKLQDQQEQELELLCECSSPKAEPGAAFVPALVLQQPGALPKDPRMGEWLSSGSFSPGRSLWSHSWSPASAALLREPDMGAGPGGHWGTPSQGAGPEPVPRDLP